MAINLLNKGLESIGINTTRINGVSYDWESLLITIQGHPIYGVSNINFNDSMEMEFEYGTGVYPVGRKYGKYSVSGSITLSLGEASLLERASVSGLVQNLPMFDIQLIFTPLNQIPKIVVLHNCKIMNNGVDLSQNDMNPTVTLDLSISHISRI